MKTILFFISFLTATALMPANGQENAGQGRFLLDDFTEGNVLMKNTAVVRAPLNYDWINQEMNYMENGKQMILEGLEDIEAISIAGRAFIPHKSTFLEIIPIEGNELFVDWKVRPVNKGKEGAMGTTSHALTSQSAELRNFRRESIDKKDFYKYDFVNENNYYLRSGNKLKMFNSEKSFLKLFPKEKAETIRAYIRQEKLSMNKFPDVVNIVAYSFTH
jgi:hypothetical protein